MLKVHESARDKFQKALEFARKTNQLEQFKSKLNYLHNYAGKEKTVCYLYNDFAPLSFEFVMMEWREKEDETKVLRQWFNGGLIYHGPHDGFGSGQGPTFSVTLTKTDGWSVHT